MKKILSAGIIGLLISTLSGCWDPQEKKDEVQAEKTFNEDKAKLEQATEDANKKLQEASE